VRSPTLTNSDEPPPTKKNNHVKSLEPHKKSNILSVTLHSGRAPNSPLQPVPVAEISHLAGELFGTPENPIHPAPKNLPVPIVSASTDATNTDNDAMETGDKKPVSTILKNQPHTANEDEMEIKDKKPPAIEKGNLPLLTTQDSWIPLVPPSNTVADEPINLSQTRDMETDKVIDFTPPLEADPLHQLNKRIERTKNYLRCLEEAIAMAKGLPPATAPATQNLYLSTALSQPKDPPRATAPVIASSQPSTIPPPNPDPSAFACLAATRPTYPTIPDPSPKRPFFSWYTWRINIPANAETPQKGFVQAVLEI
jgi:hypothetical protein